MYLGELLAVTVQLLITFTTDFLEYKHFLGLGIIIDDGSLDNRSLNIRRADLYGTLVIDEKNLAELYCSTLVSLQAVDKDILSGLNFKLLACNIYNCVHNKTFVKVPTVSVRSLNGPFSMA